MNGAYPNRKHPRLKEYDYSRAGVYFLTVCTSKRLPVLSRIVGRGLAPAEVQLLPAGQIVADELNQLTKRFPGLSMVECMIMPNHIHLLLELGAAGASPRPTETGRTSVADVMRVFKSISTRRWNQLCQTQGRKLWQASYRDHVIRDDNDFLEHWTYLVNNPARWAEDVYYL